MDDQKKELMLAVGARIRHFRRKKRLSQEELALRANLNPAYFGQVERGLKCPTVDTLYKISCALDVALSDLLQDIEHPEQARPGISTVTALLSRLPEDKCRRVVDIIEAIVNLC